MTVASTIPIVFTIGYPGAPDAARNAALAFVEAIGHPAFRAVQRGPQGAAGWRSCAVFETAAGVAPKYNMRHPSQRYIPPNMGASCVEYSPMERIGTWVDAKPHRFQFLLLAHTAAFVCAVLAALARF